MFSYFQNLLDLIFPPKCEACKRLSTEVLCAECLKEIRFMKPQFGIHAVSTYEGILKTAIHQLKFRKKKQLADPLGVLLAKYVSNCQTLKIEEVEVIIPVPLHPKRLRARGFNQAEFLAKVLQRYYAIPIAPFALERVKDTKPQFNLSREERKINVRGAFRVISIGEVYQKNILLVDDIYTTGSTTAECVKVLKSSGARRVEILALSRAVEF